MRILLLTDHHAPTGGAEKYFFELKNKLKLQPGVKVFSIGFSAHAENGKDYFVLPATRTKWSKLFWQIFSHRRTHLQLRTAIKRFQPDVIHVHNIKQHSAATLKAIADYPVVQTVHDYSIVCPGGLNLHKNLQPCPTGFQWSCSWQHQVKFNAAVFLGLVISFLLMRKRLQKTVRHFMTVSPLLRDYMHNNALQPVDYIPPFCRITTDAYHTPAHGRFLYAGHLGQHKGTYLLIAEFAQACATNPDLHLTIAGSGADENHLRALARQHNIADKITFTGWIEDLSALYQSHFAVIAPSIVMESFGLVISEAMSYQRPVIGSNRGSIPWLVDDQQTGLIFDPTKKGDLSEKILQLAANPDMARTFGINGYQKIQVLIDNDASLRHILKIYAAVSQKKGAEAPSSAVINPALTDP